jgi:hypothetical protein
LAKHVGVTQKTAWFMDHRLRSAMKQNKGQPFGTIEVDETYVGGLVRNMHKSKVDKSKVGTGRKGKAIVMGMGQRGGQVQEECADRLNRRGQPMKDVFASVVQGTTDGKQLPYKQLIA